MFQYSYVQYIQRVGLPFMVSIHLLRTIDLKLKDYYQFNKR